MNDQCGVARSPVLLAPSPGTIQVTVVPVAPLQSHPGFGANAGER